MSNLGQKFNVAALIKRSDFYLIPNLLTVSRVFAIPLVAGLAYYQWNYTAAFMFSLAGISDYVDGWIARKYHYESKLGMLLDPLADKLIIVSTMIMLMWLGRLDIAIKGEPAELVPPVLVIVTVGREIAITGLRGIASSIGLMMPAEQGGKIKTWIQFFAILFLLLDSSPWLKIGQVLLAISVVAALWSAIQYTIRFVRGLPA
ncbi:MAG: CDP-diacylglycerol--glycerol-3-phosphate 3-phosphatidyltransferase [Bacteriovoracaceae bacterium]|nr:CDP-diacylglycerol--glycerol-3-phosphate 3-phosphatidyltransferase [Bacteriovoracaceae bacterium]